MDFFSKKITFRGKNFYISGPAGGVNAGISLARKNRTKKVIGFDMGGTSTDICILTERDRKDLKQKYRVFT